MFLGGGMPVSLQRGTVYNFLIGRHLLPDIEPGQGENLVLSRDVLDTVINLHKPIAAAPHIAAGGKVAVLIDAG